MVTTVLLNDTVLLSDTGFPSDTIFLSDSVEEIGRIAKAILLEWTFRYPVSSVTLKPAERAMSTAFAKIFVKKLKFHPIHVSPQGLTIRVAPIARWAGPLAHVSRNPCLRSPWGGELAVAGLTIRSCETAKFRAKPRD